jgi:hypothetical protein
LPVAVVVSGDFYERCLASRRALLQCHGVDEVKANTRAVLHVGVDSGRKELYSVVGSHY